MIKTGYLICCPSINCSQPDLSQVVMTTTKIQKKTKEKQVTDLKANTIALLKTQGENKNPAFNRASCDQI